MLIDNYYLSFLDESFAVLAEVKFIWAIYKIYYVIILINSEIYEQKIGIKKKKK